MTETAQTQKKKTPAIVTWIAAILALIVAFAKLEDSGATGGAAFSLFAATFFTRFLVCYFILWIGSKIVRKLAGEEKKTAHTVTTVALGVVIFFIFAAMYDTEAGGTDGGLPECASESAIESVRSVLEDGANSKLVKVELLDIMDIKEFETSEDKTSRTCIGQVTLNTGDVPIKYTFYFAKSDKTRVLIEVKELGELAYVIMHEKAKDNEKKAQEAKEAASQTSGQ